MKNDHQPIKLKYYIEYALLRLLRGILFAMPVDWASSLMGQIWRCVGPFNARHKRALRHMEWALTDITSHKEREKIARAMWENLGRTFCEGLIADRLRDDTARFEVDQAAVEQWNRETQQGALLVTHHFGNWELACAPVLHHTNQKVMGIYRRIKNPLVEDFMIRLREPLFPGGLFSQQNGAARKTVSALKAGGIMAMVGDLRDNRGVKVSLFDMPASLSTFPAILALKFDKPIYVAQTRRKKGAYFALDFERIAKPDSGNFEKDCQLLTQALHTQFEKWIRANPEQWMWAPYRWSGRYDETGKPQSWASYCATEGLAIAPPSEEALK